MDTIAVRGARENNLRGVDVDLPVGKLIAVTGVSGSGKSSLAFDTLHAEGRRRYLEALSSRLRAMAGGLRRPDVDVITGLPPTIALQQQDGRPPGRSTVATFSEVHPLLRVLFARDGVQHCPACGREIRPSTHDGIVSVLIRQPPGARLVLEAPVRVRGETSLRAVLAEVVRAGFSRVRIDGRLDRIEDIGPGEPMPASLSIVVDRLKVRPAEEGGVGWARLHDAVRTTGAAGQGVIVARVDDVEHVFVDRPYCHYDDLSFPALRPELFSHFGAGACRTCRGDGVDVEGRRCADCGGGRLRPEPASVRWRGRTLPELSRSTASGLRREVEGWERDAVLAVLAVELDRRLGALEATGLGHLVLDGPVSALSSGQWQRLRLARQVGAELSGVLYVLDEPTAGVHAAGVSGVVDLLRRLRDQGNTVLVVEHDLQVIRAADHVIEFGPGPGHRGGRVVYAGDVAGLAELETPTGLALAGVHRPRAPSPAAGRAEVSGVELPGGARGLALPVGGLGVLVGPNGSGKSQALRVLRGLASVHLGGDPAERPKVAGFSGFEGFTRVVSALGGATLGPRSNPATYTGLWDVLRPLLAATHEAQIRGFGAGHFSLNVKGGRCEACKGSGLKSVELGFLPDVLSVCDVCDGTRFNSDVLEVRWRGRSASELLDLPAEEAHPLLAGHPRLEAILRSLRDVGLGYLALGQAGHTLSGGESRRLRLARELSRAARSGAAGTLFLLDDPTRGLHPADVEDLIDTLYRLIGEGATVWIATHDPLVIAAANDVVGLAGGEGL